MPEFLELLSPVDALNTLMHEMPEPNIKSENIAADQALGRILAAAVTAPESSPSFPRSTVDGFAVIAADTFGASDSLPAYLTVIAEVPMGSQPKFDLSSRQAALIHTGGMLPESADAVVMIENTQVARAGEVEIMRAVASGENIIKAGEDALQGDELLPAGKRLRPQEIGGLFALGCLTVSVTVPPKIGIISSGDEIVTPDTTPEPGQVRDVNSYSLSALIQQNGGQPIRYGIVADKRELLKEALALSLNECDAVVITAGSSASTRDLTAEVIGEIGKPGVLVHGVNVRPGKPTILAVCQGKAVIGLPGNPVSALIIAGLFVIPVINYLNGMPRNQLHFGITAHLRVNLASQAGREDWIPVRLTQKDREYFAEPIFFKSNLILSLRHADGLAYIPADVTGFSAGEMVQVYLYA